MHYTPITFYPIDIIAAGPYTSNVVEGSPPLEVRFASAT